MLTRCLLFFVSSLLPAFGLGAASWGCGPGSDGRGGGRYGMARGLDVFEELVSVWANDRQSSKISSGPSEMRTPYPMFEHHYLVYIRTPHQSGRFTNQDTSPIRTLH